MANPNAGDVLTYNGTQWINQPSVQGPFYSQGKLGAGGSPTYWLHAFQGNSGFFYFDDQSGSGKAIVGLSHNKPQQWSFRNDYSSGRFDIRDDTSGHERISLDTDGNIILGYQAALSASATKGFVYIPSLGGQPGTPADTYTGQVPLVYDTTNHKLWIYDSGWKGVVLS